jgi:hypothetical protein
MVSLTRYEQDSSRVEFAGLGWKTYENERSSGGTGAFVDAPASVEVHFTGTGLDWIALMAPYYGLADVSVDGGRPQSVDLYDPGFRHEELVWSTGVLEEGPHTVLIEWTGEKNPSAELSRISVDAFDVRGVLLSDRYEQDGPRVDLTYFWQTYTHQAASNGTAAWSDETSAAVLVEFDGIDLDWISATGPHYGIARVSVDGGPGEMVDLHSPKMEYQQRVWSAARLGPGRHTALIEWTGTKNPASGATRIGIDAFDVAGTLEQASFLVPE